MLILSETLGESACEVVLSLQRCGSNFTRNMCVISMLLFVVLSYVLTVIFVFQLPLCKGESVYVSGCNNIEFLKVKKLSLIWTWSPHISYQRSPLCCVYGYLNHITPFPFI